MKGKSKKKSSKYVSKVNQTEKSKRAYDSKEKKEKYKLNLRVKQLERAVMKERERLVNFDITPIPEKRRPTRGGNYLRGAARPYWMVEGIEKGELDTDGNPIIIPETIDLYKKHLGNFFQNKETKYYIELLSKLGEACVAADNTSQAIKYYKEIIELDKEDNLNINEKLICILLDDGRAGEARLFLNHSKENNAIISYSKLLVEYVSWFILNENESSEKLVSECFKNAFEANPYVAVFISKFDIFSQVVEYADEIKNPEKGTIEEAFSYCSKNIGVWMDTENLQSWIMKKILKYPEPNIETKSDSMYSKMYETAIEMSKDQEPEN